MSSISSVGSSISALTQQVQSQSGSRAQHPRGGRPPEPTAEMKAQFESAAKSAGIDVDQLNSLQSKIEDAVKNAVDNSSGTDPREAIQSAVETVLKDNGIDPEDLKSKLESVFEKMGAGKPGQGTYKPSDNDADDQGASATTLQSSNTSQDAIGTILRALRTMPAGSLVDAQA